MGDAADLTRFPDGALVEIYASHVVEHYLGSLLQQAGFTGIQRVAAFDLFRDTSCMVFLGVPISLNMTAVR